MKLSLRINLLFSVIVSGMMLAIAIIVYNTSRQNISRDFEQRLENRAARTAYLYSVFKNDTTNLLKSLDAKAPPQLFNKTIIIYGKWNQIVYEYYDSDSSLLKPDPSWLVGARQKKSSFFAHNEKKVCVYHEKGRTDDIIVLVAAENLSGQEYIENLKQIFIVFLPGALLVTLLAGFLFSRSIINPIKETIRDAQLITSQNLSKRLYTGKRKDELAELNATFNELLDRLEESFDIQRRFISNASHELSTPLTSVSSQIEVALLQNRSEEQYREVLRSVLEDVGELNQLTKTLLEIAKAGTHGTITLDKLRLDEVIIKAHSEVLKQNPNYNIGLLLGELPDDENQCIVFGNAVLLNSAFKNLMENGCKYSPDNSTQVSIYFKNHDATIVFSNKSDTLSAEELNRLFEPFYRSKNAEGKPGVGLGLTLTKRIIGIHKGTLTAISDIEKGTEFTVHLPTLSK